MYKGICNEITVLLTTLKFLINKYYDITVGTSLKNIKLEV